MQETIVIEHGRIWRHYWLDLWRYRELLQVLAWRDLSVRYKQTAIGVLWALIRPLLFVIVFTFVFGRIANLPSEGNVPYPLLVISGLLPWTLFSAGVVDASNSLINNSNLVTKVYFPRMIVPLATLGVALMDFLISLIVFACMMLWYRFIPAWQIVLLPLFLFYVFVVTLGPSLLTAALTVKYRDFRYIIPFIMQLGLYVTPIAYSAKIVPSNLHLIYSLNPMVSVIQGFRWCLIDSQEPINLASLVTGSIVTVIFLWIGINRFRSMERDMADLI